MATKTKKPTIPQNLTAGPSFQTTGNNRTATYLPISEQIKRAFQKTNRMPMIAGCLLGAFVPIAVYLTAHSDVMREQPNPWETVAHQPFLSLLILGGLLFSATSVSRWGYQAFGHSWVKAIGFVILVEGTLILSPIQWLALGALAYLVTINALATGTTLALDRKKHFALRRSGGRPPKQQTTPTTESDTITERITLTTGTEPPTKVRKPRTKKSAHPELKQTNTPVPQPEQITLLETSPTKEPQTHSMSALLINSIQGDPDSPS